MSVIDISTLSEKTKLVSLNENNDIILRAGAQIIIILR
jgi:hypothetical protein